jgi:hypothetical protein
MVGQADDGHGRDFVGNPRQSNESLACATALLPRKAAPVDNEAHNGMPEFGCEGRSLRLRLKIR